MTSKFGLGHDSRRPSYSAPNHRRHTQISDRCLNFICIPSKRIHEDRRACIHGVPAWNALFPQSENLSHDCQRLWLPENHPRLGCHSNGMKVKRVLFSQLAKSFHVSLGQGLSHRGDHGIDVLQPCREERRSNYISVSFISPHR